MKKYILLWPLPLVLLAHTAFSETPEIPVNPLQETAETLISSPLPVSPPEPEENVSATEAGGDSSDIDLPFHIELPQQPERPERPVPGRNISALLQQFSDQRETLLQEQQAARETRLREWSESRETTVDDFLADLQEQRRAWMEEQRSIRQDLLQRMNDMREEFRNRERDVIIENAREDARSLRERVGQD